MIRPWSFILYTTPLSTVIYNSAANHHLHADDTKLLIILSFTFLLITDIENIIANESNWLSSSSQLERRLSGEKT